MSERSAALGAPAAEWDKLWRGRKAAGSGVEEFLPKHRLAAELLERLRSKTTIRTVCDFGCGSGTLLRHLQATQPGLELSGADFSSFARSRITALGIRYIDFDLDRDTLDTPVDVGILVDVLEHFHEPTAVVHRLEALRYVIVVVPNFSFLTERLSAVVGRVPFQWRRRLHATWFNVSTLEDLAASYQVVDKLESYPSKLSRLPLRRRWANLLATSLGIVLDLRSDIHR